MSDIILRDTNNKIWKDSSGKILKGIPFNEETLSDGKIVEYVAGDFNLVAGYIQAWQDSVGSNDLIQNNASNQPAPIIQDNINTLKCGVNSYMNYTSSFQMKSMFFVTYLNYNLYQNFYGYASTKATYGGYGATPPNQVTFLDLANLPNWDGSAIQTSANKLMLNNVNYTLSTKKIVNNWYIMYLEFPVLAWIYNYSYLPMFNNNSHNYGWLNNMAHMTFYNKALKNSEITYNFNALAKRYNITL